MSTVLTELSKALNSGEAVLKKIAPPINEVSSGLVTVESDVGSVISFVNGLNDMLKFIATIGEICSALVEIPVVGQILEGVGNALTDFGDMVGDFLKPVEKTMMPIVKKAKSALHKINGFLTDIAKYLNYFMVRLPKWANIVQVINFGWQVCDILVGLLLNTGPGERLKALMTNLGGIGTRVKQLYDAVSGGLTVAVDALNTILKPFWESIKSFFSSFEPIANVANKVFGVFHTIDYYVDVVEDAIKPIKWALDAIKCIIEKIVNPVLNWIMEKLGIKALFDSLTAKFVGLLHLDGLQDKITTAMKGDMDKAGGKVKNSHGNISKVGQLEEVLKEFIADPQQALMTDLYRAITGTPVKKDAFPPKMPSPQIDFGGGSKLLLIRTRRVRRALPEKLGPVGALPKFPTVSKARSVKSPTDFSDLDTFINDINGIVTSFKSVVTLGKHLQAHIKRTENQLVIPSQLHGNLIPFQTEIKFLYDTSRFLQGFPVFKVILPPLTGALYNELGNIGSLDTDMTKLVASTTALSTSLQPILYAESPTLLNTIKKMTTSLNNWSREAQTYKAQILHAYEMDKKFKGKFKPRIDDLANTYHTRLGELQTKLSQIKEKANAASTISHSIVSDLGSVSVDFDEVDKYVERLEQDIAKVAYLSKWAGKIDGILDPLTCMKKDYKCEGDQSDIKSSAKLPFSTIMNINGDDAIKKEFQKVFQTLLNEFFPVKKVHDLVKTGNSHVEQAEKTVNTKSQAYLAALKDLISMRAGKYQFKHINKITKQTETISSHFFDEKDSQKALKLGNDMGP